MNKNARALKVIRTLHSRQKKQAKKIDILCRDMVSAHRQFSVKLSNLNFAAEFYESLFACTDLEELMDTAVRSFRMQINLADAAIFLLSDNGFDVHIADSGVAEPIEKREFRNWFTRELVDGISRMNRICSLDQLLRMGLQGPPSVMKTISLAAVPLGRLGQGVGFVLIYRPAHLPLQPGELSQIAAVSTGLREAIRSFKTATAKPESNKLSL